MAIKMCSIKKRPIKHTKPRTIKQRSIESSLLCCSENNAKPVKPNCMSTANVNGMQITDSLSQLQQNSFVALPLVLIQHQKVMVFRPSKNKYLCKKRMRHSVRYKECTHSSTSQIMMQEDVIQSNCVDPCACLSRNGCEIFLRNLIDHMLSSFFKRTARVRNFIIYVNSICDSSSNHAATTACVSKNEQLPITFYVICT